MFIYTYNLYIHMYIARARTHTHTHTHTCQIMKRGTTNSMSYHLTELAWQAAEKVFFYCSFVLGHAPSHIKSLKLLGLQLKRFLKKKN